MVTFLRWLAILVMTVVLLAAGLYVAHGIHATAEVRNAKRDAVADLAAALPGKKQQAVADRTQVRDAYVATWGRPAYAWQELVCHLETVDAGWIVEDYTQGCRIVSVDLIPAGAAAGDRCEHTELPGPVEAGEQRYAGSVEVGPASAFDEDHPYRFGCPDGVVAPQRSGASRLLDGRRPTSLGSSPAWIVVTVVTAVTETRLGCDPWDLQFCDAPVDRPVLDGVEQVARVRSPSARTPSGSAPAPAG
jgi:hypothetical protein